MQEENLYGLPDEVIDRLEKEVAHAEIDAETSEQFLDLCFPNASPDVKAKISIFAAKYAELFYEEDE
ncbi:MAG: hypothetical protein ACMXYK_02595 [Candidatus Woesearchaeota archaeon]